MSCFLLFVTLISTFQDSQLGRKTPLWARVVDLTAVVRRVQATLLAGGCRFLCQCERAV